MAGSSLVHARLAPVVVLLLGFLSNPSLSAQVATGSIVGTVTDSSNQIVPGAQVTIREVNRNTTTTLVTDASGVYTAPFLVPGTYEVQVELQGFKTWIRPGIILQVTDRVRRTRAGCSSRSRRSTTCSSAIRAIVRPTTREP